MKLRESESAPIVAHAGEFPRLAHLIRDTLPAGLEAAWRIYP
jgi:hypothetical protein